MCCKRYHIIFSTFSLKFKCKICFHKEVIHNYNNHILVTWPATNLIILRKWCGFEKPNHYYFVFRRQNHITFIFIKTMSHDHLVQMACWALTQESEKCPDHFWMVTTFKKGKKKKPIIFIGDLQTSCKQVISLSPLTLYYKRQIIWNRLIIYTPAFFGKIV